MNPQRSLSDITVDDILRKVDGEITFRGNPLPREQVLAIKRDAENFQKSVLWQILSSEVRWIAIKTLLEQGQDANDIRAAQLLGFYADVIDKKLAELSAMR